VLPPHLWTAFQKPRRGRESGCDDGTWATFKGRTVNLAVEPSFTLSGLRSTAKIHGAENNHFVKNNLRYPDVSS